MEKIRLRFVEGGLGNVTEDVDLADLSAQLKEQGLILKSKDDINQSVTIEVDFNDEDKLISPIKIGDEVITQLGIYKIDNVAYWIVKKLKQETNLLPPLPQPLYISSSCPDHRAERFNQLLTWAKEVEKRLGEKNG